MVFNRLFEQRGISYQSIFASGEDIALGTYAGTNINSDSVYTVGAIFSAVNLISTTLSTLPLDVYIRDDGTRKPFRPKPAWVNQPDVALSSYMPFYSQVFTSMLLEGNAFIRVYSNRRNEVVSLMVLNPLSVEVKRNGAGGLIFNVEGEPEALTQDDIIFIPDLVRPGKIRGVARTTALKESFGLSLALDRWAQQFFGSGSTMNGVIEYPGALTADQAADLRNGFDNAHKGWQKAHRTGVLTGGATFKATQIDAEKAQVIEARRMAVEDVARAFNIPPHLLGLPGTNSYASVEQNNLAWVTHNLRPLASKVESAMSILMNRYRGGSEAFLRFNLSGLLRADLQSRTSSYSTMLQAGAMSINEVRALEDMPPITMDAASQPRVPLANVNIEDSYVKAQMERVKMVQSLVYAGFSPEETLRVIGLDSIEHTGLASVQLQNVAQQAQAAAEADVDSQYKDEVT
jgi:HK97 family phage portal protein